MVSCADQNVQANLAPIQDESLMLVVDRYGGGSNGDNGFMSGNMRAALTGELALASFVIWLSYKGMYLVFLEGRCCEDHILVRRYNLPS